MDAQAFLFTLKNHLGTIPTRFMIKDASKAIYCFDNLGPLFGSDDIHINNKCNQQEKNSIDCKGTYGLQDSSLFVNTAEPENKNTFTVLDYEVFGYDYENHDNISKLCKYPDIIWEYIQTKDISEQSLKQLDEDRGLLNDLNVIHCENSKIRLKISLSYFKNPSSLLLNTQIVDKKYDPKLREWLGRMKKWKLIYRASEYGYTPESFHQYCDNKGPTLVVIKSTDGWIFGGYTTQSWSGCICYYITIFCLVDYQADSQAFIFTLKNPHGANPDRFMIKEAHMAIFCNKDRGPEFGNSDISICDKCNQHDKNHINFQGAYGCQDSSFFLSDSGSGNYINFTVLDYEVFNHE